ncbi:hypothetical protein K458DRAFT_426277 [Lentithecium fluviatile CBS 122367]|uniref:Uncharacterized protein n=1 Tax=Lentithecium fluviatile CBS 122367 TaxID=1168545 RepID=A0A6G1JJW8_9PLEO|nr:hypothetical protein K458DRAFT_426277 [Lentithecium fluviatile CBS 122367]
MFHRSVDLQDPSAAVDESHPRAADKYLSADKYPICVSWGHWRVPVTDTDLPSAFSTLPIDPHPPSLRNGGSWRTSRAARTWSR